MSGKWATRVYVDLFAGAGRAIVKPGGTIIEGSPLIALGVEPSFDRYVFCEKNRRSMEALRDRVSATSPTARVEFIARDCNVAVSEIVEAIPSGGGVLTLCFVDPYAISNLKFATIRELAARRIDFLVLVPTHMDINRNQVHLRSNDEPLLDQFLGDDRWRAEWQRRTKQSKQPSFGTFILDQFGHSMQRIGYLYDGPGREVAVTDGSRILYYLALYSRNTLGAKFWRAAVKAGEQPPLF